MRPINLQYHTSEMAKTNSDVKCCYIVLLIVEQANKVSRKDTFYLMMHTTHFIMVIWHQTYSKGKLLPLHGLLFPSKGYYMHRQKRFFKLSLSSEMKDASSSTKPHIFKIPYHHNIIFLCHNMMK